MNLTTISLHPKYDKRNFDKNGSCLELLFLRRTVQNEPHLDHQLRTVPYSEYSTEPDEVTVFVTYRAQLNDVSVSNVS
jgi:hypothetical protein